MNTATAQLRNLRIAPRKVRLIADAIRGKSVPFALALLNTLVKKGSQPVTKLLRSATANAKLQFQADERSLRIAKITVDEGAKLKRWMPRSRGQSYQIQKKTSHITIVLEEQKEALVKEAGKTETASRAMATKEEKDKKNLAAAKKPAFKQQSSRDLARRKVEAGAKRMFRRKSV